MQMLTRFLEILLKDEPEAVPDYGTEYVSRREFARMQDLYVHSVQDRREQKMRADCFEAELLRRGETVKTLAARVELHKRTLKRVVRSASA